MIGKMYNSCFLGILVVFVSVYFATDSFADSEPTELEDNPYWSRLKSHEVNTIGFTHDDNDVPFMDFKISLKYPLFHTGQPVPPAFGFVPYLPYLAFTGRFGQYITTRDSSPVISKRFNPELFVRGWFSGDSKNEHYISLAYGHESNGQSIDTLDEYLGKRGSFRISEEDPDFANDYISRGWDYLGFNWQRTKIKFSETNTFTASLILRYYLENGLVQGEQEEYNSWENDPEGKPRNYVDGIRFRLGRKIYLENDFFASGIITASITTGYSKLFKYNTYRLDWGVEIINMPLTIWISSGYNSDLSQYYSKVTSFGIGFDLYSN
ncbi:MAG: hypothetical protein KAR01_07590 [Desulfocapsa sp.]|nr:hypothetical protein [Desulfocapsa sp.]